MTNEDIQAIYLQECEEGLASAEAGLLDIQSGNHDGETINTIFRAVHSIKGGAGAFGFTALQAYTHQFETLLDTVRDGELAVNDALVTVMLAAFDTLSDHVAAIRGAGDCPDDAAMLRRLQQALAGETATESVAPAQPDFAMDLGFDLSAMMAEMSALTDACAGADDDIGSATVVDAACPSDAPCAADAVADHCVTFTPVAGDLRHGGEPLLLLRELVRLGGVVVAVDQMRVPPLEQFDAGEPYLSWTLRVPGPVNTAQIREIFDFISDPDAVTITRFDAGVPAVEPSAPVGTAPVAPPYAPAPVCLPAPAPAPQSAPQPAPKPVAVAVENPGPVRASSGPTIRVDLEKLDRLVNLVGELVITQSMLSQQLSVRGKDQVPGMSDLDQLTRELQDSVMAIRAQPVKSVFSRVPRIVRELESATGKRVTLEVEGEGTELDKTVIEHLGEPLTHLIRNCIDHGIELPADRIAKGKPAEGRLRLVAEHKGGRILICVSDDGAGINRDRVLAIAQERGIVGQDAQLSAEEIDNLILAPGFSTAREVSNISGRGVGMDVVSRSVQALGGRVSIQSTPGQGSAFTLALPLTLAIADGMLVSVGAETFVVPLTHVVENIRPAPGAVQFTGAKTGLLNVRGAYLPVIRLADHLGIDAAQRDPSQAVLIIVDSESAGQAILMVDTIIDQRQVVIKSLETHYHRVDSVAGATILGDGRVALILDVEGIVAPRASYAALRGLKAA